MRFSFMKYIKFIKIYNIINISQKINFKININLVNSNQKFQKEIITTLKITKKTNKISYILLILLFRQQKKKQKSFS